MYTIKIAEIAVGIDNRYEYVKKMCADYIVNEPPVFTVCVTDEQLATEREIAGTNLPNSYYESVCIYREICNQMIDYNCFLFHSSVIELDGKAYAFSAKSGVGKSTHTRLWIEHFGERVKIINGDKPLLRVEGDKIIAYGTPWSGKERQQTNSCAPLCGVCFIKRAEENSCYPINSVETVALMFHQLIMPKQKQRMEKLISMLDVFVGNVPFYMLNCNISDDAVTVCYNALIGKGADE